MKVLFCVQICALLAPLQISLAQGDLEAVSEQSESQWGDLLEHTLTFNRRLQISPPSLEPPSECLTSCPGVENASSELNQAGAGWSLQTYQAPMTAMITTLCSYQSEFACMMQECPSDSPGSVLGLTDCLCRDCPAYASLMANMMGLVSLMLSGNADPSSLMAEMCSYIGPLKCVNASSSCSSATSDETNAPFYAQILDLESNCTAMNLSTGVNDATSTTTSNDMATNITKDAAAEWCPSLLTLLCLVFFPLSW